MRAHTHTHTHTDRHTYIHTHTYKARRREERKLDVIERCTLYRDDNEEKTLFRLIRWKQIESLFVIDV